jgi:hypothetical protein
VVSGGHRPSAIVRRDAQGAVMGATPARDPKTGRLRSWQQRGVDRVPGCWGRATGRTGAAIGRRCSECASSAGLLGQDFGRSTAGGRGENRSQVGGVLGGLARGACGIRSRAGVDRSGRARARIWDIQTQLECVTRGRPSPCCTRQGRRRSQALVTSNTVRRRTCYREHASLSVAFGYSQSSIS